MNLRSIAALALAEDAAEDTALDNIINLLENEDEPTAAALYPKRRARRPAPRPRSLRSIAALALAEDAASPDGAALSAPGSSPDGRAALDLSAHDRRHHPKGYREGDSCKYRESLGDGDEADVIPADGEPPLKARDISGEHDVLRMSDVVKGKTEDELRRFLRGNKDTYVRLYHGTGADVSDGLKRTSTKNRRTPNSTHGFVYLATDPAVARRYGEFGYPGEDVSVYAVDVKVRDLLSDKDSIFLARRDSGIAVSDDLASSLFNIGNARVRRDIMPYEMHQLLPRKGNTVNEESILDSAPAFNPAAFLQYLAGKKKE